MRTLHPVAAHERFIAQGLYRFFNGQTATGVIESWSQHEVGDGATLTRIDYDGREASLVSRLAEVLQLPDGNIERLTLQIQQTVSPAPYRIMRLDYVFLEGYVQMTRQVDRLEREYIEQELPASAKTRLLDFVLFWGDILVNYDAETAPQTPVFVPLLKHTGEMGQVVKGALPVIEEIAPETVTINHQEQNLVRYRTKGQRVIWLNDKKIPVKMSQYATDIHQVLANYAHR